MIQKVLIWENRKKQRKNGLSYMVTWSVDGKRYSRTFRAKLAADIFRSELRVAVRKCALFSTTTGMPLASAKDEPAAQQVLWVDNAIEFVDWRHSSASTRDQISVAEGLAHVTIALASKPYPGNARTVRVALKNWLFNSQARRQSACPKEYEPVVSWAHKTSPSMAETISRAKITHALTVIGQKIDGTPAANATRLRKLSAFSGALKYAAWKGTIVTNPLTELPQMGKKAKPYQETTQLHQVVSFTEGKRLLTAVGRHAPPLEAYFALMFYAALRPAEALAISATDLTLPSKTGQWGWALLRRTVQRTPEAWLAEDGPGHTATEVRGLKHRAANSGREVPLHPNLVTTLQHHLSQHPIAPDGRLFVATTTRGGHRLAPPYERPVAAQSIYAAWEQARANVLPDATSSDVARRPYDLRHTCVSHWLASGVPAPQVAAWAGHSVPTLLRVYAKVIRHGQAEALAKISAALPTNPIPLSANTAEDDTA